MQQVTTRSLTPLEYSVTALAWQIHTLLNLFLHLHLYLTPLFPDLLQPWGTTLSFPSTPCMVPSLPPCCLHAFCGTLTCEDQLRCFSGGTIRSDSLTLEFLGLLGCASLAALAFCGRKVMTNLDSIFKSRDITLPTNVCLVKAMVFPVIIYVCESWTVRTQWAFPAAEFWVWIFGMDAVSIMVFFLFLFLRWILFILFPS